MKLALITSRYPKENQPYNHMFVHVRALYFQSQHVEVTILVPACESNEYKYQGITVIEDTAQALKRKLGSFDVLYLHLLNQYPLKNGGYHLYQEIMKHKYPTAIYLHGADVLVYPEYLYDFTWTLKGICKYGYVQTWNHYRMKRFLNQISTFDHYLMLTPSNWMKNHTEKIFKRKFDQFYAIPNGIDTALFDVPFDYETRYKLITIRPLSDPKYGVDMAITLMRFLPDLYTLDIYGKGDLKASYEALIRKYNLEKRIRIIDTFIEREELPVLFSKYGIFCAFSRFDSQGVIMCEAMAARLLTISNFNSAIPEFIKNEQTGLLNDDLEQLAATIVKVSANENQWAELVEGGRSSMEAINWEKQGEKELTVLRKLM
ncbi:glycosyltransferase family 4 protein [Myroides odoratus]|uniref:glycosyltransferase family 4 protein n=1 Tax=Myroides odoratus TaxID=256 RepID=UPI00333F14D8